MKTFEIPSFYRSPIISRVKALRSAADKMKKDFTPTLLNFGNLHIYVARHFGFCYGVENAIDIAFKTIEENEGKRIFLLSEMIHNPQVNADLLDRGVQFLQDTHGKQIIPFQTLTKDDVVIIPAFGTTLAIEEKLNAIGIQTAKYNTTCPFVEKVWNRSEQIAKKNYTVVVHGKPTHEETRATFSHAAANTPTVVVNDMKEAIALGKYISREKSAAEFYSEFADRFSEGFDATRHFERIGVVNQTTMLASDTQAIADYLKQVMIDTYQLTENNIEDRFAETRDTLCYATNDNQSSTYQLLESGADLAMVVGGYNSSNTSHIVDLCERKFPTFFINSENEIKSPSEIHHFNYNKKQKVVTYEFLPEKRPLRIVLTSGASCPDTLVDRVLMKMLGFFDGTKSLEDVLTAY